MQRRWEEVSPHRRLNQLTREWVLVCPHRTSRPWLGQVEKNVERGAAYDAHCFLCPGNVRAASSDAEPPLNPHYSSTFAFDNDFSALLPSSSAPHNEVNKKSLLIARSERGVCRVICYSPLHNLTLPLMTASDIRSVIDVWCAQSLELGRLDFINYVQIFENKGTMMGCSNPHPHCQIWASESLPVELSKETESMLRYRLENGTCLLCDYFKLEQEEKERIVFENEHFLVVIPYWATWPFETLLIAKRHVPAIEELSDVERTALAEIIRSLTICYDNLFAVAFPYSMGFHQQPCDNTTHPEWHLHAHFYPPLLRSASIKKFMVGYELLANAQRDLTAEHAAEQLRRLPSTHYSITPD